MREKRKWANVEGGLAGLATLKFNGTNGELTDKELDVVSTDRTTVTCRALPRRYNEPLQLVASCLIASLLALAALALVYGAIGWISYLLICASYIVAGGFAARLLTRALKLLCRR